MSDITDNLKNVLKDVDADDIKFVISIGSDLIKAGMDMLDMIKDKRDYSVAELIDISNESVLARNAAQAKAHEYIKAKLSK